MSNTCDDPNWPERFRRPTLAAKRAKLVEEIGWALKDQQAEIDSLKALLTKSMARTAEVREAAERLRALLVAVPSWEALLPKNCGACEGESDCAGEHEPCGCHETLAVIEASLALLSALRATASPAPGSEGVREAVSENDVYTLIGHAEYLRKVRGEEDMPKFFDGLARRLLAALRGGQKGVGR